MRILHTSDWHLGRAFGGVSLAAHQASFVDWLVEVCREQTVDLVVVAGDVFDRAIAPTEAVALFREALRRLRDTGALVAVITGNHDGPDRVASYGELLDLSGVYIRGGYRAVGEVIALSAPDGPLDLVMLPFLDPQAAPDSLAHDTADDAADTGADVGTVAGADPAADAVARLLRRTHHSVLAAAVEAVQHRRRAPRSLAVAHAFVDGGTTSQSERQLVVGGTGAVPADLFAGFSYSALGHLHRPQHVAGSPVVRYSGTPLAYSFSEVDPKSVTLVDMAPDGACTVHEIPVPVGRRVHEVTGTIDELLGSDPGPEIASCFVKAILTDDGLVPEPKQRLLTVFPHLVEIELRPAHRPDPLSSPSSAGLARLTPSETVARFWEAARGHEPLADVTHLVHDALVAVAGEDDL